jgi:hypothetical protein
MLMEWVDEQRCCCCKGWAAEGTCCRQMWAWESVSQSISQSVSRSVTIYPYLYLCDHVSVKVIVHGPWLQDWGDHGRTDGCERNPC